MSPARAPSPPQRTVLLLLDGHSLAYRAFYALPEENFTITTRPAHQRDLRVHLDADQRGARRAPTHVAVAFDVSRRRFRTEKFPEYKAQALGAPDEFAARSS